MNQLVVFLLILFSNCFADDSSSILMSCFSNEKKWPALHYAIEQKQRDTAKVIISLYPEQITLKTPENQTAFELALIHEDEELAQMLLESGFPANQILKTAKGDVFPLYFAIKHHALDVTKTLLEKGVEPFVIRNKMTAIELCVRENADEILQVLLQQQNPDIIDIENAVTLYKEFEANERNWPALHYALFKDDLKSFTLLLQCGSDPNFQGNCPQSLYRLAMEKRDSHYTRLLQEYGFNLSQALLDAISFKDTEEVFTICSNENWAKYNYSSALWSATRQNMANVVQLLLEKGVRDNPAPAAPRAAGQAIDKPDIMGMLLQYDAYPRVLPNAPNAGKLVSGYLEQAVRSQQYDTCRILLENGVFPNEVCLRVLAYKGNLDYIQLFHENNALNDHEILYAIEYKNADVVNFLLDLGYIPSENAFRNCIRYDTLDCFKVLHAQFEITAEQKKNYLKCAIDQNKIEFVEYICSYL